MSNTFKLPKEVIALVSARDKLKVQFNSDIKDQGGEHRLKFTFDGNLVGDIGEALAVNLFGIRLVDGKSNKGIDGFTRSGKTVQVKATGTGRGPAFSQSETQADYLLFFDLNFQKAEGTIVYNGPEKYVREILPARFPRQASLTSSQIRALDQKVRETERLRRIA